MKPIHIGLLVAAGALAGAIFVKMTNGPEPAPVSAQAPAPATPTAPAAEPAKPAEPLPSPFAEAKEPVQKEPVRSERVRPEPARKTTHAKNAKSPVEVAQNRPPASAAPGSEPAPAAQPAPAVQPAPETPAAPAPAVQPESPVPPPPPPPRKVTLNAGTLLPVRLVEGLSTERNQAGDTFTATLDQPLVADGFVIAERGARLEGRVVEADQGGRVRGVSSLGIELTRLTTSDGQKVAIHTETFTKQGQKSVGKDAAKVGAAAGIGAAIGAIAGGGKGAAIGAAVGGAAGTGGVMATRGEAASIRTETRLDFRLSAPVTITERQQ